MGRYRGRDNDFSDDESVFDVHCDSRFDSDSSDSYDDYYGGGGYGKGYGKSYGKKGKGKGTRVSGKKDSKGMGTWLVVSSVVIGIIVVVVAASICCYCCFCSSDTKSTTMPLPSVSSVNQACAVESKASFQSALQQVMRVVVLDIQIMEENGDTDEEETFATQAQTLVQDCISAYCGTEDSPAWGGTNDYADTCCPIFKQCGSGDTDCVNNCKNVSTSSTSTSSTTGTGSDSSSSTTSTTTSSSVA